MSISTTRRRLVLAAALLSACAPSEIAPYVGPVPVRLTQLAGDEGRPVFSPDGRRMVFTAQGKGGGTDLAVLEPATGSLNWVTSTPDEPEFDYGWTSDGQAVVYGARGDRGMSILRTHLSDLSTVVVVPPEAGPSALRFSHDFEELAFVMHEGQQTVLWTGSTAGGEITRRTEVDVGFSLAGFTADNSELVGTVRDGALQDLYAVELAEGVMTQLTEHPDEEWYVAPAPVGEWVAFYSTYDTAMTDVRMVDRKTGEQRQLTSSLWEDYAQVWSPDGERIAFLSDRQGKSGLWMVHATSGAQRPVLPHTDVDGWPVWSADGDHIVFGHADVKERLYSVAASGGAVQPFGPDTMEAMAPSVSPDGTALTFTTRDFNSEGDIVLLDIATGAMTPLSSGYQNVKEDSWSPDGTRLSIRKNPGGWFRTAQIHVLDLASRTETRITDEGWIRNTLWCGDHVYFLRTPIPGEVDTSTLWRIPAEGGESSRILPFSAHPRDCRSDGAVLYSTSGQAGPELRWLIVNEAGAVVSDELAVDGALSGRAAPDGRIAYVAVQDRQTDLFVSDPSAPSRLRLTDTPWTESTPDWSADGTRIYFSARPGDVDLWWVEVPQ